MKAVLVFLLFAMTNIAYAAAPAWYGLTHGPAGVENEPYFKGVSQTYFVSDSKSEQRAQDEACSDAMRDIAKYFGVNVKVETNIKVGSTNGSKDINFSEKTAETAGLKLFGLKPEKTSIERIGNSHLRAYCLVVLRPTAKAHIDKEIKRNQVIYDEEINNLRKALIAKDIHVAKLHAETLQALPLLSKDDRLPVLINQLKEALRGVLSASIKLNKESYNVGDEVKFYVSLSQGANLYVLMDTGSDWQVLYPNMAHRIPLMKAGIAEFPSQRMENDGVIPVVFKDMFNKNSKIHLIATKSSLPIERYSETSGLFDYLAYGGDWEREIKNCVVSNKCVEQRIPVKISNPLETISLMLEGDVKWIGPLRRALKKRGIRISKKGNCRLRLRVGRRQMFSERLNMKLNQLSITADLNIKDDREQQLKINRNNAIGMDESKIRESSMSALAEKVRNALVHTSR